MAVALGPLLPDPEKTGQGGGLEAPMVRLGLTRHCINVINNPLSLYRKDVLCVRICHCGNPFIKAVRAELLQTIFIAMIC